MRRTECCFKCVCRAAKSRAEKLRYALAKLRPSDAVDKRLRSCEGRCQDIRRAFQSDLKQIVYSLANPIPFYIFDNRFTRSEGSSKKFATGQREINSAGNNLSDRIPSEIFSSYFTGIERIAEE